MSARVTYVCYMYSLPFYFVLMSVLYYVLVRSLGLGPTHTELSFHLLDFNTLINTYVFLLFVFMLCYS